jgi:putative toxin-antitoxin system antitoxin component (TIGR02293 family)
MTTTIAEYQPATSLQIDFWSNIGIPDRGAKLYEALHNGLPFGVYGLLAEQSKLDKKELAKVTVIAPATLQRRAKSGRFSKDESDRLYRFAAVLKATNDLFEGDADAASAWLTQPVRGLGDKTPVSMLSTSAEAQAVFDLIGRLEHGVFC